jgi:hypothetical protein
MVFISVVPDNFYFLWQIELQLLNFNKFGIAKSDIHILIGADRTYGLSIWFSDFIRRNDEKASFFVYRKEVDEFTYKPSIRPHILKQHFTKFPQLSREVIFYHDSDIIFRELPDFNTLCAGEEWWLADCRSYIDSKYLKSKGEGLFEGMCSLMQIDPAIVVANDGSAGGAQSILKGVDAAFWAGIEQDCERLFGYLKQYDRTQTGVSAPSFFYKDGQSIQSWCTDMWVLFWTGLKRNRTIGLSAELNFSWACDPIADYTAYKIYHNAGAQHLINQASHKVFDKIKFNTHSPYYFRHEGYSREFCSWEFVKLIREFEAGQPKEDLSDTTFLIPIHIDSEDRMINLEITTRYLYKHFHTQIIVVEAGPVPKVDTSRLSPNTEYHYVEDHNRFFHRTRYNNQLIKLSRTRFVALYDVDVVLPPAQIMESLTALREGRTQITYPYSGIFYGTAPWVSDLFRMTLDHTLLQRLEDKHHFGSKRSLGGCVFLEKATFIANGGENEHLTSWGPDDLERAARYKILGYTIHRVPGNLYHLHHERGINSGYQKDTYAPLMSEYLEICSRTRDQLVSYIQSWDYFTN